MKNILGILIGIIIAFVAVISYNSYKDNSQDEREEKRMKRIEKAQEYWKTHPGSGLVPIEEWNAAHPDMKI